MRVTITETEILVVHDDGELPLSPGHPGNFTCRTAAQEVASWAVRRLGEELQKSHAFFRTGKSTDSIVIE